MYFFYWGNYSQGLLNSLSIIDNQEFIFSPLIEMILCIVIRHIFLSFF